MRGALNTPRCHGVALLSIIFKSFVAGASPLTRGYDSALTSHARPRGFIVSGEALRRVVSILTNDSNAPLDRRSGPSLPRTRLSTVSTVLSQNCKLNIDRQQLSVSCRRPLNRTPWFRDSEMSSVIERRGRRDPRCQSNHIGSKASFHASKRRTYTFETGNSTMRRTFVQLSTS